MFKKLNFRRQLQRRYIFVLIALTKSKRR